MTINVLKHSGFYVENELCLRGRMARRAVGRWMGGKCSSPEQGWQWFEQVRQHWRRWFCLLSYHFSGLLSQGLGEHCLWHNETSCLSLQPFIQKPQYVQLHASATVFMFQAVLTSVQLDSFSHFTCLGWICLCVWLVGLNCLVL